MKSKVLTVVNGLLSLTCLSCSTHHDGVRLAKHQNGWLELRGERADEQLTEQQRAAEQALASLPHWALNTPQSDEKGVYAVGIAHGQNIEATLSNAQLLAKAALTNAYKQELQEATFPYISLRGQSTVLQYPKLIESILNDAPLSAYRIEKQALSALNGSINAYVLMTLPFTQFAAMLQKQSKLAVNQTKRRALDALAQQLTTRRNILNNGPQPTHPSLELRP